MTLEEVIQKIDWELFKRQRFALVEILTPDPVCWEGVTDEQKNLLDGLLALLDAMQDAHEGFPSPEESNNYCPKCGCHWVTHNDDGSCVKDYPPMLEGEDQEPELQDKSWWKGRDKG